MIFKITKKNWNINKNEFYEVRSENNASYQSGEIAIKMCVCL